LYLPSSRRYVAHFRYPDFREALIRRGWKLNPDVESPHFDLKFTLKSTEIRFPDLLPHQIANHFSKASVICTKAGLLSTLRGAHNYATTHDRLFAPRSYDLGDPTDYVDFVDEFRAVEAERVVRSCVVRVLDAALSSGAVSPDQLRVQLTAKTQDHSDTPLSALPYERALFCADSDAVKASLDIPALHRFLDSPGCPRFNLSVLQTAVSVLGRRCRGWDDVELDSPAASSQPQLLTSAEWEVLRYCDASVAGGPVEQAPATRAREIALQDAERLRNERQDRMVMRLKRKARRLRAAGGTDEELATAVAALLTRLAAAADDDVELEADEDDVGPVDDDDAGPLSGDECGSDDSGGEHAPPPVSQAQTAVKFGGSRAPAAVNGGGVTSQSVTRAVGTVKQLPVPAGAKPAPSQSASALATRTRATVSNASRRIWRDKLVSLGADTSALSDDVGNPTPTLSAAAQAGESLSRLSACPVLLWQSCINALCAVNASADCQATLNAVSPRNVVSLAVRSTHNRPARVLCTQALHLPAVRDFFSGS
jgi:hypothetical protein